MTEEERSEHFERLIESDRLLELADEYVEYCRDNGARLPNISGFLRRLRFGAAELDRLRRDHKLLYRTVLMTFEDEAINSSRSPSLVSVYLKQYLREDGDAPDESESRCGALTLVFDHDIAVDGG